jgi:menaquinone-dependent protoporphyrinogen oxidase
MKLLIIYGTGRGQTARIARYIAQRRIDGGDEVDVVDGRSIPASLALDHYDAVIVGASVNAGRFQRYIVDFVRVQRDQLRRMPSAFFSVSLTEAEPEPRQRARAMHPIERFVEETGWQPDRIASFAGSIAYLRRRWLMRLIWRRLPLPDGRGTGQPAGATGTASYEYTDWEAVARFATEFATQAREAHAGAVPV